MVFAFNSQREWLVMVITGLFGTLTIQADGQYSYIQDATNNTVTSLAPGATLQDAFTYTVTDGTLPDVGTVTVTVTADTVAALEIIDSRIADWRITLCDTIADLASIGAVVLSSTVVPLSRLELRTLGMHISVGAGISATGAGAATLGDPLRAAAWLVNTLAQQGQGVSAGQIILTGALHAAIPIRAGDVVRADFDQLGSLTCRFRGSVHDAA